MKHLSMKVEGIVQGVGFRWAVRAKANQLGVSGFARNEDDESVTIEAEADEAALELFRAWCEQGPVTARVDRVTVESGTVHGYSGFEIR
jgi:acylphosphatase